MVSVRLWSTSPVWTVIIESWKTPCAWPWEFCTTLWHTGKLCDFFICHKISFFFEILELYPPLSGFLKLRWIYRRRAMTRILLPARSEKEKRRRIGNLGIRNARPRQRYALLYAAWRIGSRRFHIRFKEVQKHII